MSATANVLIYGSCVSRDLFESMHPRRAPLAYVARQSLISATTPPVVIDAPIELASAFQRRMVESDFGSLLIPTMAEHAEATDLFLVDILDERLGVFHLPGGSYITSSSEVHASGVLNHLDGLSDRLWLGTDEHFDLWSRAAGAFVDEVDRLGLRDKTVVIETRFADHAEDGQALPAHLGKRADEWNSLYGRYFEHLSALGLPAAAIPQEFVVGSTTHKWGLAPYHYVDGAYHALADQIRRMR